VSQWTHPICTTDFKKERGEDVRPVRTVIREVKTCCWCGKETASGIYLRADPSELAHHRQHVESEGS